MSTARGEAYLSSGDIWNSQVNQRLLHRVATPIPSRFAMMRDVRRETVTTYTVTTLLQRIAWSFRFLPPLAGVGWNMAPFLLVFYVQLLSHLPLSCSCFAVSCQFTAFIM